MCMWGDCVCEGLCPCCKIHMGGVRDFLSTKMSRVGGFGLYTITPVSRKKRVKINDITTIYYHLRVIMTKEGLM